MEKKVKTTAAAVGEEKNCSTIFIPSTARDLALFFSQNDRFESIFESKYKKILHQASQYFSKSRTKKRGDGAASFSHKKPRGGGG